MSQDEGSAAVEALQRFYAAEGAYMKAGGGDFAPLAATLHPEVVLHQSPDCPGAASSAATQAMRTGRAE